MGVFEFVIVVVAIACGSEAYKHYLRSKRAQESAIDEAAVTAELEALRERVEVLEKILTDRRYQLEDEFDQLQKRG